MSSVSLPSGLIKDWCVQSLYAYNTTLNTCNNNGAVPADYQTICCDGDIVDIKADLTHSTDALYINLEDLRCCSLDGPQQANELQPIVQTASAICSSGTPTPLASLAATNIHNAAPYEVTYTSALGAPSSTDNYVPQIIPTCLWANTKNGVAMQSTTVPSASITTPVPTGSSSASESSMDESSMTSSASAQSSSEASSTSSGTASSSSSSGSAAQSTLATTGAAPPKTGLIRGLLAGLSMSAIIVTML